MTTTMGLHARNQPIMWYYFRLEVRILHFSEELVLIVCWIGDCSAMTTTMGLHARHQPKMRYYVSLDDCTLNFSVE